MPTQDKTWLLLVKQDDEKKYMHPLFSFVFHIFNEIFGEEIMLSECCVVYNNPVAHNPMLITR